MRRLLLLAFLLLGASPAFAQSNVLLNYQSPTGPVQASAAHPLPVNASVSASISGFAPSLAYATCTATGSACASTALPTNTGSVILFNTGTTTVSCTLASGAATALANELQIPASSGLPLSATYGATTYDHFSCIDQTGSTSNVVIASGGSGLPTGWGGGGSGGSSGAVFGPTANGSPAANPPVIIGGTANGTGTGNVANATIKAGNTGGTTDPAIIVADPNVLAAVQGSIAAGSNIIGKVGVDQTTPGWNGTNAVTAGSSVQISDTPTVTNAAYASGNCIGGFRSVTITNYNGESGFVTNFRILSVGGVTPSVSIYIFDSNPSSSTCTDKGTFTLAAADVDKLINNPATSTATLAAPTGTTSTVGSVDYSPPRPFVAGGSTGSGVKTIYYALVSGGAFTPATTTDIHVRVGAALN